VPQPGVPATVPANGSGGTATITAPAPSAAPEVPPGYRLTPIVQPQRPVRPASAPTPPSMTLLYVWILLFGFVGTQLAWTLRPFFGSPGMKFSLYRDIDGNFYAEIFRTLSHLF
jgi:hypothetical protein